MSKKSVSKKGGNDDAAAAAAAAEAAASASGLLSPRSERQRVWSKRAEEAEAAIQQVKQLLQQYTADIDGAKQSIEQLTHTAAALCALDVDQLPPQYRDKSRPPSQRIGSGASARGGSGAEQRSSSKQGQRASNTNATAAAAAATAAGTAAAGGEAETVEAAVRQVPAAQRSKVSAAMHALFSAAAAAAATPMASPIVSPKGPAAVTGAATPSFRSPTAASSPSPVAADGDAAGQSEAARKGGIIPLPLLQVMRELQATRLQLEAQLAVLTAAATRQAQRSQLLQEEAMVAQYALEALRGEGTPVTS